MSEARLHVQLDGYAVPVHLAADLFADGVDEADNSGVDVELREANFCGNPASSWM
ncbi:MAG: hypothetical protein R3E89_04385 [Thiolinea sp.]